MQIERFLDLLFGSKIISPLRDEYGMYLAHAAALRSSSLARQVGAAILSSHAEVLAIGTNEVPRAGGGQYWQDETPDERDHVRGYDSSDAIKTEIMAEVFQQLESGWDTLSPEVRDQRVAEAILGLKNARVMNLTEFTRAVHAEMEALSAAGRVGVSVRGAVLYTTTFPCHGCAKHVVVAGICRVVYIEPYPKSLAMDLHNDSIALEEGLETKDKVRFEPFVGVAPRRYTDLFSATTREGIRLRRKDASGKVIEGELRLRISMADSTYMQREANVAQELKDFIGES
jgi:deoxycytidylate deaminase